MQLKANNKGAKTQRDKAAIKADRRWRIEDVRNWPGREPGRRGAGQASEAIPEGTDGWRGKEHDDVWSFTSSGSLQCSQMAFEWSQKSCTIWISFCRARSCRAAEDRPSVLQLLWLRCTYGSGIEVTQSRQFCWDGIPARVLKIPMVIARNTKTGSLPGAILALSYHAMETPAFYEQPCSPSLAG